MTQKTQPEGLNVPADHLMGVYSRTPLAFERGEGVRLFTADGEAYLDALAGIAVNALGHSHPKLIAALKAQADKLWHVSNIFTIPEQVKLASALTDATFADVVFFTNSGTEAIECAIKAARKFHWARGQEERIDIIGFDGSFHGRTLAAVNASGMTPGSHGSTYGGNPLAMAVGLAAVEELSSPALLDHVAEVSGYFTQQLEGLKARNPDVVEEIRGRGLLIGLKLKTPNREFMQHARDEKLLIAGGGDNCVRLLPPLVISVDEVREVVEKLERACARARGA